MKIISKYKDYYDSIVNTYGIDEHVVYIRDTKEIENFNLKLHRNIERDIPNKIKTLNNYTHNLIHDFIYVGFCGLIYPCLKITKEYTAKPNDIEYIYNYQQIKETYHKLFNQKDKWVVKYHNNWNDYRSKLFDYDRDLINLFQEHKCSAFLLDYALNSRHYAVPITLTIEPNLKELQFYKSKDAVTAFQDVSVFVAEQLNTEIDTFTMTDKQKILSNGFDEKYGFRTRPK